VVSVSGARREARQLRGLTAAQARALGDAWRALWMSRLLLWLVGVYAILKIGFIPGFVAPRATSPYGGGLANLLVGPAARWDSGWYLTIAAHGYDHGPRAAFFPLYPLLVRAVGFVLGDWIVAGIAISFVALYAALYLLWRLVELDLGERYARAAVLAMAFFPMALFFSAVYTESLLLALTIGAVYAARNERWALAGALGALAAATRNTGVLILIPLVLLYLYGPRGAGAAARAADGRGRRRLARLAPRYALRAELLWLALAPVGLLAFLAYTAIAQGDFLLPIHVNETYWHRHFHLLRGIPRGATAVWHALVQITSGSAQPRYGAPASGELNFANRLAVANLVDAGFLVGAALATVGVLRRLPFAYGAYCIAGLAAATSAPVAFEPLASLPRYVAVLFPMYIWLSRWVADSGRLALLVGSFAFGLGVFETQFATWRWVA
jgi:hypothetical protein